MKNQIKCLLTIFISCAMFACKQNPGPTTTAASNGSSEVLELKETEILALDVAKKRAEEIYNVRHTNGLFSQLTEGYWHYEVKIQGNPEPDKTVEGTWIKFNPDFTFTKGYFEAEEDSGRWAYNSEKDILLINSNSAAVMPEQWRLMNQGSVIICTGTAEFKNNDTQMKWNNQSEKPLPKTQ